MPTEINDALYTLYGDNGITHWTFISLSEYFLLSQSEYAMCVKDLIGDPQKCEFFTFERGDYVQINKTSSGFQVRKSDLESADAIMGSKIRIGYKDGDKFFPEDDGQGDYSCYFKSGKAFQRKEGVCYIGELAFDDEPYMTEEEAAIKGYSYTDLLALVGGNAASCIWLFNNFLKWADPSTDLLELESIHFHMCSKCSLIYDTEETENCPSCGTSAEIDD